MIKSRPSRRTMPDINSGLIVNQLGDVGARQETDEAKVEVERVRHAVIALIFHDAVRLTDRRQRRRHDRVDGLSEFNVVAINGFSVFRDVAGLPDLRTKLISRRTKEVLGRVRVLVDTIESLGDCIDREGDSVGESHDV